MSRVARIARNIVTNWLGFVVSAGVTLMLTPVVLADLGPSRYGIWVLTSSIVGYYGILDLGFRAGLTQHLTRYLALREFDVASEYLSSAVAAMSGFAVFVVVLGFSGAYLSPTLFDIPADLVQEAFWCILIVGLGSSVQFALFPFAAIFPAAQRFDIANYIGITTRLLNAAFVLLALKFDYGLVGVSAATFLSNFIDYALRWQISVRIVPQLRFSRRHINFSRLKDILSFGIWNFLISINEYAYQHAPNFIIVSFLRLPAVGQYALATGMMQQISSLLMPVGQVMYPVAVGLYAQGDKQGLKTLYHDGTRLMMIMMISVVLVAGFFAEDFYRLWIGEEYLTGEPYHSVALLLQVLLASTFTSYTASIGIEIIKGSGRIRLTAITLMCGSLLNVTLSLILVQTMGLLGIAVAVVVASAIIDFFVIPFLVQKHIGLSVVEWVKGACVRPLLVGLVDLLIIYLYRLNFKTETWWDLLLAGIVSGGVCVAVALTLGLSNEERKRFIWKPMRTKRLTW